MPSVRWIALVLSLTTIAPKALRAELVPDYDATVDALCVPAMRMPEPSASPEAIYFKQPIPARLHQVAFGPNPPGPTPWVQYAAQLGYTYRLWDDASLPDLQKIMAPTLFALVQDAHAAGAYAFASHVARIAILGAEGGIYVDLGYLPPKRQSRWLDLREVTPMRGLVLTTLAQGRNIGRAAMLASDGWMMAAPHHPLMMHLGAHLAANHTCWLAHGHAPFDTYYGAGVIPLNLALGGVYTVMPHTYWQTLGVHLNAGAVL